MKLVILKEQYVLVKSDMQGVHRSTFMVKQLPWVLSMQEAMVEVDK